MGKSSVLFITTFTILIGIACLCGIWLSAQSDLLPHNLVINMSVHMILCQFNLWILLGIGFGLPLFVLALLFSWVQFYLLNSGKIEPHLSEYGFLKTLSLLLDTIFE